MIDAKLVNQIRQVETVSFDIFDTLLHRLTFAPVDVFDAVRSSLLLQEVALLYPKLIENFPRLRRLSEERARSARVQVFGGEGEITFDEIYDQLNILHPLTTSVRELLQQKELELEKLFFYRSEDGFKAYSEAIRAGKKILFVSDMYLPPSFLIEVLNDLGYLEANGSSLFVSGELRCSKHSGQLYLYLIKELSLEPSKWLHIGDNEHADVLKAKSNNLNAYHAKWSKVSNVPRSCSRISDALPASLIQGMKLPQYKSFYNTDDDYEHIGYSIFGPFLFGFYAWLLKNLESYQPDKILFFARDAFLIKQIHELVSKVIDQPSSYDTKYVSLSRKSVYPFSFVDFPLYRINSLVGGKSYKTLQALCQEYGIDLSLYSLQLSQLGLNETSIASIENHERITKFFSICFDDLIKHSSSLRHQFGEYFVNLVKDNEKVAVIDIGWVGNIQFSLSRAIAKEINHVEMRGFYIGVLPYAEENIRLGLSIDGWFNHLNSHPEHIDILHSGGVELLEFALTSSEGTTLGYERTKDGKVQPILEVKDLQEQVYENKALKVQYGILKFVENYAFLFQYFPLDSIDSLEWSKPFCDLVKDPTAQQIALLADLTHADRPGSNNHRIALAKKIPRIHGLLRTKLYKQELSNSFWKKAFYFRNHRAPWKRRDL